MSREWKPGDVALVNDTTQPDKPWEAATCTKAAIPGKCGTKWRLHRNDGMVWSSVSQARPLVVIDPEDREQVERLTVTLADHLTSTGEFGPDGYTVEEVRDALREFASPKPPKPDEPKGVGAVVEDSHGEQYVQIEPKGGVWRCTRTARAFGWDSIPVVRVLSEGVVES